MCVCVAYVDFQLLCTHVKMPIIIAPLPSIFNKQHNNIIHAHHTHTHTHKACHYNWRHACMRTRRTAKPAITARFANACVVAGLARALARARSQHIAGVCAFCSSWLYFSQKGREKSQRLLLLVVAAATMYQIVAIIVMFLCLLLEHNSNIQRQPDKRAHTILLFTVRA